MEQTVKIMFELIKSVMNKDYSEKNSIKQLSEEQAKKLFKLSKIHDLAHLVGYAIKTLKIEIPSGVEKQFASEQIVAVCRYEQQVYELKSVSEALGSAGIDFIPLKGSVLREFYPEPWLRTSCDIDILIKETDFKLATEVLTEKLGYKQQLKTVHEISLFSPSNVHLELHRSLIEEYVLTDMDKPLENIWEYAFLKKDKMHHHLLTNEMYYYYHLAHMAKHYVHGGCGIRPFLDIKVIDSQMEINKQKFFQLLNTGRLLKFYYGSQDLSNVWFGDSEHTQTTLMMQEYLLKAGAYGSLSNRVVVEQAQSGGKFKNILSRIWVKFDILKAQFPILKKHKWLMPFCQVARWFKIMFGGRFSHSVKELKENNSLTEKQKNIALDMLNELGLNEK